MKKLFFTLPFIIVLILIGVFVKNKLLQPKKVHYHAGFIVVKANELERFTDTKYMLIKPCTTGKDDEAETEEEIQKEKAHLHDGVGDVVHVEREGGQWKDLFTNISYPISYNQTTAYLNGKKVSDIQDKVITPYDSLVLSIGENSDMNTFISQAVTRKHIEEVEANSEDCGSD